MHRVEKITGHLSHEEVEVDEDSPSLKELICSPVSSRFEVPDGVKEIRRKVVQFIETYAYPLEHEMANSNLSRSDLQGRIKVIQQKAKDAGLWALGHPKELGGGGLPFMDYVYVNEVQGRSEIGQVLLGTYTLQDSLMLWRHGTDAIKKKYLSRLVSSEISPSFAMTEPGTVSSDPTGLRTRADVDGEYFVINGRKWFTSGASRAPYTAVMVRTEHDPNVPIRNAFSIIIVPTDNPGYKIIRDTPVLGIIGAHCEVVYDNVRVKISESLLGERGSGFRIAQERLGPGRIFHCMRWLGQAQRAFDLMCQRLQTRKVRGEPLGKKQLMQKHVFDSFAELQASRLLTLSAARKVDQGGLHIDRAARIEIGVIKVVGAKMLHNVVDRAIQVFGAAGLTDDFPLSHMYRAARFGRIYDGPDEVHMSQVARNILRIYEKGDKWDFGTR